MKRLFQIILVLVILLLITIHQAIAGNVKRAGLRNDKNAIHFKHRVPKTPGQNKKFKTYPVPVQPDIVKEYITKRNLSSNLC